MTLEMHVEQETTGLFVYAVVRADHPVPAGLTGVDGNPVDVVVHGPLAVVVGELALDRPPGRRADLTAYSSVVEALLPGGPVAPVRFGCVVPDADTAVAELLAPDEGRLGELLEFVDGRVQLNLRATYVEDAVLAEIVQQDPRIHGLSERTRDIPADARVEDKIRLGELVSREWDRLARADADRLLGELAPMVAAHAVRREPGAQVVLDAALLVDAEQRGALEDRLEALAEELHGRVHLRLVGPVAPFDFVGST